MIWLRIWIRFWVRFWIPWILNETPLNRFDEFRERVSFSPDEVDLMNRLRAMAK